MKAFKFVLGALLLCGVAATAQETSTTKIEAGFNYSSLHVNSANLDFQRTGNGGSGYFEYNLGVAAVQRGTWSDDFMTVIRTYLNRIDAELAKKVLASADIESMIEGDDCRGLRPNLSVSGVRLSVRPEDAVVADEILGACDIPEDVKRASGEGSGCLSLLGSQR